MERGINNEGQYELLCEIVYLKRCQISLLELTEAFRDYCECVHHIKRSGQFTRVLWDKAFQIITSPLCSIKPGFGKSEIDLLAACRDREIKGLKITPYDASQRLAKALEKWEEKAKNKIYLITSSYWSPLYSTDQKRHTVTNIDIEEAPRFIVGDQQWSQFCSEDNNKADQELVEWYRLNEIKILQILEDVQRNSSPEIYENQYLWGNSVEERKRKVDFVKAIEQVKDFWGCERNGAGNTPQGRLWPLFLEITKQCHDQELGWTLNSWGAEKSRWKSPTEIRVGVAEGKEKYYTAEVRNRFDRLIEDFKTQNRELTSKSLADAVRKEPNLTDHMLEMPLEIPFFVVQKIRENRHFPNIDEWLDAREREEQSAEQVAKNFIDLVNDLHDEPELQPFLAYVIAYVQMNFGFLGEEEESNPLTNQAALVIVGGILIYLHPFLCEHNRKFPNGQPSDDCLSLHLFPMELDETCIWNIVTRRPIGKTGWYYFNSMGDKLFTKPLMEDSTQKIRKQAGEIEARWYGEAIAHEVRVVGLAAQNEAYMLKQHLNQKRGTPLYPDCKEIGSMKQSVNELLDTLICLGEYADKTVDYLYSMRTEEEGELQLLSFEDILSDKLEDKIYSLVYGKLKKKYLKDMGSMQENLPSLCPVQWQLSSSVSSINVPRIGVEIALVNLIANAVFHSVAQILEERQTDPNVSTPSVSVSLKEIEGGWHFQIHNPGLLSPVMIAFVQNKLDEIPTGGVGLSIVKHIAERYATCGWKFKYNEEESINSQQVVFNLIVTSVKGE